MEVQEEVAEGDKSGEADSNRSRPISASNSRTSTMSSSGKERIGTGVEEHRSLGGSIISRLDNGAFVGLIYELLVFSWLHVEVVPPVTTHPCRNA